MNIRECSDDDLISLNERWPIPGDVHGSHKSEQDRGDATYLVAWENDEPLGIGMLWWQGCLGANAKAAYPLCVEIIHLQVRTEWRGRGVGTSIIEFAERHAASNGRRQIGLGVSDDNPDAARLYRRLGYRPTGIHDTCSYTWTDDNGVDHAETEHSELLVKPLEGLALDLSAR